MTTRLSNPQDMLTLAGTQLGTSAWHDITQERVNLFADATGTTSGSTSTPVAPSRDRSAAPSRTVTSQFRWERSRRYSS
jgi:hypothetical protein